jgi:phosphoserine phosphatase RsbU/P
MPKLIGTDSNRFYSWSLVPGRFVVGRNPDCDFAIPHQTVSRRHAEIEIMPGGLRLFLTDLGSHNGTAVNGKPISTRTEIRSGDHIAFGQTEFKISADDGPAAMPSSLSSIPMSERDPERSVVLSMNEALKPLPAHVADIPGLLPTLFDMAKVLVIPESKEMMLQRALGMVAKVIPADRLAVLFVSDDQEEVFTAASLLTGEKDPGGFNLSRTIINDLLREKNAILIGNPQDDPHFAVQQSIIMSDLRSAMAVPLFDEDRVLGILYVDTTNPLHRYSDEYLRLLATFGNIIASRLANFTLLQEREVKQALEVELRRASMIQKNLLPATVQTVPGYLVTAFQEQSRSVGGDLYDFALLPDGRFLFMVADVSGKGMGAALLMSNILASFRSLYTYGEFDLVQAVRLVSLQLYRYTASDHYATLFIGTIDPANDRLSYVNAGHNPPLLIGADGRIDYLQPSGTMIGAFDFSDWTVETKTLSASDTLFIFTDGVTEAMKEEEQYTDARLEQLVVSSRRATPEDLAEIVMRDVDEFIGDSPRSDDITMLIIRKDATC